MHTRLTARITVCSLVLRFVALVLIGIALTAVNNAEGGTVEVLPPTTFRKSCFLVMHSFTASVDIAEVEGPSATVDVRTVTMGGEGQDGPCGMFPDEATVVKEWKESKAYCLKEGAEAGDVDCTGADHDAAEQGWCYDGDFFKKNGLFFEHKCKGMHADFNAVAMQAGLVYSLLLLVKLVIFCLECKERSWTERAPNKCIKWGFLCGQYWLVSSVPTVVMAPVTGISILENHDIIVIQYHYVVMTMTLSIGGLIGLHFLVMSVLGSYFGGSAAGEQQEDGFCRASMKRLGWGLTLGPLLLGAAIQIGFWLQYWDFPVLNFRLIFSFSFRFAISFAIDLIQLILFVAAAIDLFATGYLATLAETVDKWGESDQPPSNLNSA